MTYRQAQELGGQVRRGERGSQVVYMGETTKTRRDEGTSVREVAKVILKCHPATLYRELDKSGPASTRANALAGE